MKDTTMSRWSHAIPVFLSLMLIVIMGCIVTSLFPHRSDAAPTAEKPATVAAKTREHAVMVGSDTCEACHADTAKQLDQHFHGKAMAAVEKKGQGHLCEGCHGAGSLHANDPTKESAAPLLLNAKNGAGCLSCHANRLSTAKWRMSEHHKNNIGCVQCHTLPDTTKLAQEKSPGAPVLAEAKVKPQVHAVFTRKPSSEACLSCHQELRAQLSMPSHHPIKEGIVSCASCHDPHAPMGDKIKSATCVRCHAKQRGMHIYEHAKAGGLTDGCLDCHRPHASPNRSLLKMTGRGLCLQCHGDRATHFATRNCQSCHQAVHGSNTNPLLMTE